MTGETKEQTEPWVEKHGMQYAYGYMEKDNLSAFMKSLGMGGYPSACLVDPKGVVVWEGHPASINSGLIEKHLKGADRTPVDQRAVTRGWPEAAKAVEAAFSKGNLADALEEAKALTLDPNTVLADVERVIGRKVDKLKARHDAGDFYGFEEMMKDAGKDLSGLPQMVELDELLKNVKRDRDAKAVITQQKKLAKLAEKLPDLKDKELDKLADAVKKIAEKSAGTYAETQANELLKKIAQRLGAGH